MVKKLWLGVIAGAAVGGAIALLDKKTREETVQKATNLKTDAQYLYYNRGEIQEKAQGNFGKLKSLIENVIENKDFYLEKIAELKETTPQLNIQIQKTKDAFTKQTEEVQTSENPIEKEAENPAKAEDVIHL